MIIRDLNDVVIVGIVSFGSAYGCDIGELSLKLSTKSLIIALCFRLPDWLFENDASARLDHELHWNQVANLKTSISSVYPLSS